MRTETKTGRQGVEAACWLSGDRVNPPFQFSHAGYDTAPVDAGVVLKWQNGGTRNRLAR